MYLPYNQLWLCKLIRNMDYGWFTTMSKNKKLSVFRDMKKLILITRH